MNNATHENAIHPVSVPRGNDDENSLNRHSRQDELMEEQNKTAEILHQLDQVRYNPRAEAIRHILNYSDKKHKALH